MRQRDDLIFTMPEYERRLARVREAIAYRGLDAMIITTPENLFYLTGYQTPGYFFFQALVLPVEGEPFMVTRLLEESNVTTRTWVEPEHSHAYSDVESPLAILRVQLGVYGLDKARLGYEKHCYFFRATEQERLFASARQATFVDCSGLVEVVRLVKSEEELGIMRRAADATMAGMRAGLEAVAAERSENNVAAAILQAMTDAGSERPAMGPFVASAWRGAVGHAMYENRRINRDEAVFVEVGGCVHNYHTAMMRTVFVGEALPPPLAEAELRVQDAVAVAMETIRPGVAAGDVDAQCRYILDRFAHGHQSTRSGYSIGIGIAPYWGEGHTLSIEPTERRPFEENMTLHLIPWVQMPGVAGVGLSETIRVIPDGCESFYADSGIERRIFLKP